MSEHVTDLGIGVEWEPNADDHVLAASDHGDRAVLVLNPHLNDADDAKVILVFDGVRSLAAGPPNDEARHLHPLFDAGLKSVLWAGEVIGSETVKRIDSMSAQPSKARHFVILLKEDTVEVVAESIAVRRMHGHNADLAASNLRG